MKRGLAKSLHEIRKEKMMVHSAFGEDRRDESWVVKQDPVLNTVPFIEVPQTSSLKSGRQSSPSLPTPIGAYK